MSETFECPTCGYRWQQGQHGGHSCSDRLLQQLEDAKIELNSVLVDWNAIVSASGSKTHGGAVGHVAQMRAELEAVKAERDELKVGLEIIKDEHMDILSDVIDAKTLMRNIGIDQADFPAMFANYYASAEKDRARIEAAEKQEPFACHVGEGFIKYPAMNIKSIKLAAEKFGYGYVELYAMPPMPAQQYKLPDNWEENIYDAMDEAFKLGKFADGGMQNDDTQIGVEFAVRHFKKMLENKNG